MALTTVVDDVAMLSCHAIPHGEVVKDSKDYAIKLIRANAMMRRAADKEAAGRNIAVLSHIFQRSNPDQFDFRDGLEHSLYEQDSGNQAWLCKIQNDCKNRQTIFRKFIFQKLRFECV